MDTNSERWQVDRFLTSTWKNVGQILNMNTMTVSSAYNVVYHNLFTKVSALSG